MASRPINIKQRSSDAIGCCLPPNSAAFSAQSGVQADLPTLHWTARKQAPWRDKHFLGVGGDSAFAGTLEEFVEDLDIHNSALRLSWVKQMAARKVSPVLLYPHPLFTDHTPSLDLFELTRAEEGKPYVFRRSEVPRPLAKNQLLQEDLQRAPPRGRP